MSKFGMFVLIFLLVAATVSALGVARPFFKDNTAGMDANESLEVMFQLQNMESGERRMVFSIDSQHEMQIEGASFYEKQFILASGELKDVSIEFYAGDEGLYRVDYAYSEECSSSGGICLDAEVRDTFFIQVGDDNTYWGFDIPLQYAAYRLYTDSTSADHVTDLRIISDNGLVEVDFSGTTLDLTGFQEQYVSFGNKSVTIDSVSYPMLNQDAVITMYQVDGGYIIYRDGVICSSSVCNVLSYSNRRLRFEANGFSTYSVGYGVSESEPEPSSGGSSGGSGGSPGGSNSQVPEEVQQLPEPEPEQEPDQQITNLENMDLSGIPNPFAGEQVDQILPPVSEGLNLDEKGKTLLTTMTLLGLLSLISVAGLLFYYKKYQDAG